MKFQKPSFIADNSTMANKAMREIQEKYNLAHLEEIGLESGNEEMISNKRSRNQPSYLRDFALDSPFDNRRQKTSAQLVHELLISLIEAILEELEYRFNTCDISLWSSLQCLDPEAEDFLSSSAMNAIFEYSKSIPAISHLLDNRTFNDLQAECKVFKAPIASLDWDRTDDGR